MGLVRTFMLLGASASQSLKVGQGALGISACHSNGGKMQHLPVRSHPGYVACSIDHKTVSSIPTSINIDSCVVPLYRQGV